MNKTLRKTLSIILAGIMLLAVIPFAFAYENTPVTETEHSYSSENGVCDCGAVCEHSFGPDHICTICSMPCPHNECAFVKNRAVALYGSQHVNTTEVFETILDDKEGTCWYDTFSGEEFYGVFYCLTEAKLLSYIFVPSPFVDNDPELNWDDWTIYGSDSADGEWTLVHQVRGAGLPIEAYAHSAPFEVNCDTAYKFYKIVVEANINGRIEGDACAMSEMYPVFDVAEYYACTACGMAMEAPAPEEPSTEEPTTNEPTTNEPTTNEPATEEPTTQDNVADSEDTEDSDVCDFCHKVHKNLCETIVCLIKEFFAIVKRALRV